MEAEKEHLSEYMSYEDGQIDQTFLTPETINERTQPLRGKGHDKT